MNISDKLIEIDKTTGDVNECLQLLKRYKHSHRELYSQYKQYWILVYIADMDLDSIDDCLSIPEEIRLEKIKQVYPEGLKYFSKNLLIDLLDLPDDDLLKFFQHLWKVLPCDIVLERILKAESPEEFFSSDIRIEKLPDLEKLNIKSLKILIGLSSSDIISETLLTYYKKLTEDYTNSYVDSFKKPGYGRSITLENFRIVKFLMKLENSQDISNSFFSLAQNILANYLAPPIISLKRLPFEMEEILSEIDKKTLIKLKELVFTKLFSYNIKSEMSEILTRLSVDCTEELKIHNKKSLFISQMKEDLALELLLCRTMTETEEKIIEYKKEALLKNLRS